MNLLLTALVVVLAASCFAVDERVCTVSTTGTDEFHHVMAGHIDNISPKRGNARTPEHAEFQDYCQSSLLLVEACNNAGYLESFTIRTRSDCVELEVETTDFCSLIESSVTPGSASTYSLAILEAPSPEEQFAEYGEVLDYSALSLVESFQSVDSLIEGDVTFTFDDEVYPLILETKILLEGLGLKRAVQDVPENLFFAGIFPNSSAEGAAAILGETVFVLDSASWDPFSTRGNPPTWKDIFHQYLDVIHQRALQRERGIIPNFEDAEHSVAVSLPCGFLEELLSSIGIGSARDVKQHLMEEFHAALQEWAATAHDSEVRGEPVSGFTFSGDFGHAYEFHLPRSEPVEVMDLQFSFPGSTDRVTQAFKGVLTFLREFFLRIELASQDEVSLEEFTHSPQIRLSNLQVDSASKRAVGTSLVVSVHATCDGLASVCLRGICTSVNIINCLSRQLV